MPYSSVDELPKQTASLSPEQKRRFKEAFNSAYEKHGEEAAFKIAWSAVHKDLSKKQVKVSEHTRSDGTKVSEHLRNIGEAIRENPGKTAAAVGAGALVVLTRGKFKNLIGAKPVTIQNSRTWDDLIKGLSKEIPYISIDDPLTAVTAKGAVFRPESYARLQGKTFDETLTNVESFIKGRTVEHGFVIDRNSGSIMAGMRGTTNQVNVPVPQSIIGSRATHSLVFTHNHPKALPLSGTDVHAQWMTQIGEARAVLPNGTVSRMRMRPRGQRNMREAMAVDDAISRQHEFFNRTREALPAAERSRVANGDLDLLIDHASRDMDEYVKMINDSYDALPRNFTYEVLENVVKQVDASSSAMVCLLPTNEKAIPSAKGEFLHVTLCFLGEGIPEGAKAAVCRVAKYLPIRARVGGVGVLGDEDPPATVLFLNGKGLRGAREMAQVHGAPEQHEPFIAHMTIGYGTPMSRAKGMIGKEILLDRVALVQANRIITEVGVKDIAKSDSYDPSMDLQISEISKLDEDHKQAFGWASIASVDGRPVVDLQGDVIGIDELEKAAYSYVLDSRVGGVMHQRVDKSQPKKVGTLIESFVVTPEKIEKMGLPDDTPQGWWIGFQVEDDEVWKGVKEGTYSMFSIHGKGRREPVELTEERLEKYAGWVGDVSKSIELEPDEVEDALGVLLAKAGLEATDTNLVALVESIEDEVGHTESVEYLAKHLIGNHDQEDHDPTKSGAYHSRGQHKPENLASGTARGALAGTGNVMIGGIPQILRRVIHGDPNKRFQKNSPDQADVSTYGEDDKKRKKDKSLTDRQRRVLSRHLGMKDES